MSVSEDLIDFDVIENQKENIQSLPQGRSARNLAKLFSPSSGQHLQTPTPSETKNLNDAIREEYETELMTIAESDDPLDIYDRYVKWTFDAYPSAQATPASQLAPLLERATKSFLNSPQYKNDPRYLKLWLSYIRFFSDTPRETFAFLARHSIGEGLALFYEEFASWLEGAGRWVQAEEVYQLGIDKEARPAPRLLRKFNEFKGRFAARPDDNNEPSSPALPTVRPALAAKIDPYAVAAAPRDPQAPVPSAGVGGSAAAKSGKQKMKIFSDDGNSAAPALSSSPGAGWQSIGSLAERKKENIMEPKPWVGETLKAGGKKSSTKIPIFKDESQPAPLPLPQVTNPELQQVTVNPKNGRNERIFVSLEAVYPTPEQIGTELSFEELRASHCGWLTKLWEPEIPILEETAEPASEKAVEDHSNSVESITQDLPDKLVLLDENGRKVEPNREGKQRRMKVKEVNKTQIISAKLSSPSGPKKTKRKSREATMTLHTKAATDEIYDIFNQPLDDGEEDEEEEESDDDDGDMTDGDYTSGAESTATTGRLIGTSEAGDDEDHTDVKSVSEWSDFTTRKHVPEAEEDETRGSGYTNSEDGEDEEFEAIKVQIPHDIQHNEEVITPVSPEVPLSTKTSFVPIPPEDCDPPTHPYRDPCEASQNRLPFMTPIVERTESSLGLPTVREQKDYFHSTSPSKASGSKIQVFQGDVGSSPLAEIINDARPTDRFPQPQLGKKKSATPTSAKEAPLKGPIILDAQCNPVDNDIRDLIFANLPQPLSSYEGFFEYDETSGRAAEIKKYAKAASKISKNASEKTSTNLSLPPILQFPETDRHYTVKRELGSGAFAPVYLVESTFEAEQDESEGSVVMGKGAFEHFKRQPLEALKMEDPPSAWEFYIMRQAKRRLGVSRPAESILDVYEMHIYQDEGYLIEEYRDQGTLLEIVNICSADAKSPGSGMDESLAMFFTIELFRTVEALHSKGILHGDLKADNCLVRFDTIDDSEVWSPKYRKDGTGGWNRKGISMIDFGRGIDMKVFKPDVQFIADWKTGPTDCAEMRELRPWTYQIDYHGLAGVIHTMLFGKYIDTIAERGGEGLGGVGGLRKWRIKEGLKRYWQTEIWGGVFDLLLNPASYTDGEEGGKMPVVRGMRVMREEMENWLETNSERGAGLMKGIRKLEECVKAKRR